MANVTDALDRFLTTVDRVAATVPAGAARDAIDAVLSASPRQTQVASLRDSPVMQKFRDELTDGLIRIDTLNQVLRLAALVLERLPAM